MWDFAPTRNEFIDALVNRIGLTIIKGNLWTNPLAKFKRGLLEYGDTIEEVNIGLLEAKTYDPDRDYLEKDIFGAETPDVQSSFHKVNRQNYYKLTIKEPLLRRAFLTPNGLSEFITKLMATPTTSDSWDEFLLMASLFEEYERAGGFFKVNIPDLGVSTSDGNDSRYALRRMREMSGNLGFISTHYNASGMPVAATPDELELFITPEANAAMDVEALAGAFNIGKAEFASRTTIVPKEHFNIPGAQAVLTTRDFFVVADQRLENTSAPNPVGLFQNYFFHHWQVISASRFVPAVLFTTDEGTVINLDATPVVSVSALTLTDTEGGALTKATRGDMALVAGSAVTDPTGGPNDAVRLELTGALSERTYLSKTGVLYIAIDEDSESVTVTAYATDTDIPQTKATLVIPIIGDKAEMWPNPEVLTDDDSDSLLEVTPVAPTFTTPDAIHVPNSDKVVYKNGATVVTGTDFTITGATGAQVTIVATGATGYEIKSGATASWTFTKA
jgi:hypothetical protein